MEDEYILEQTTPSGVRRTTFLTVLCILSWVGCMITTYTSITAILTAPFKEKIVLLKKQAEDLSKTDKKYVDRVLAPNIRSLEKSLKWRPIVGYLGLAGTILCLFGSVQMWKLRKRGFYFYALGELIPITIGIILLRDVLFSLKGIAGTFVMVGEIAEIIIVISFVYMYSTNLKHMR